MDRISLPILFVDQVRPTAGLAKGSVMMQFQNFAWIIEPNGKHSFSSHTDESKSKYGFNFRSWWQEDLDKVDAWWPERQANIDHRELSNSIAESAKPTKRRL